MGLSDNRIDLSTLPALGRDVAGLLNDGCFCIGLDRAHLAQRFAEVSGDPTFFETHETGRSHLFADVPLFLDRDSLAQMEATIGAIERAKLLPGYQEAVLAWAPEIARVDDGLAGVFMGYDFHMGPEGPRLIEINTNAGGAVLNALMAQAHVPCCPEVSLLLQLPFVRNFEQSMMAMFREEWRRFGAARPLTTVAIVDDDPEGQFLYPEFVLVRSILERHGIEARVVASDGLTFRDGRLWADGFAIDLVYNRLVGFALERPEYGALRAAYLDHAVALTPGPRHHALLADKRNLVVLSDRQHPMQALLSAEDRVALERVPQTEVVNALNAARLWDTRKGYFFKPFGGHGSKAVYRGDKVTRKVWESIVAGGYVAQVMVALGRRQVKVGDDQVGLKSDIRIYTYDGASLLAVARLYDGQTTNMRTSGGGFAPVLLV